ncbi:3-oxoacyl-ACP synthase III family protein [Actinomadura sp. LOL_016]|uniref:3-oxoacyl-ACP synthase III family protein n=1 Tax=unclassified Actinomadura TaxID=2626254 RepID=UPI003A7F6D04
MNEPCSRLAGVAVHLPETTMTTGELEDAVEARSPGVRIPRGVLERASGVRRRHVAAPHELPSDLAVTASLEVLDDAGARPADLDLIVYAGVLGDTIEPATAHVVAAKLGASCPVFDVRNACNGFVNAIEVADAFIARGTHRRILIACGELLSAGTPWRVGSADEFFAAGPHYTFSDAGAAMLVEAASTAGDGPAPGVLATRFAAESASWPLAAVHVTGLSSDPDGAPPGVGRFDYDFLRFAAAFNDLDLEVLHKPLVEAGLRWDDFAAVCVHQAALPYLWAFCDRAGIPHDRTVVTIAEHGNVASASLPLQLAEAVRTGMVRRGDLVALVGLASGISAGIVIARW